MTGDLPFHDEPAANASSGVSDAIVKAASREGLDGAGCLLMDGDGGLRFVMATGSPGRVLEAAEELCVEGPCHEAFVTGSDVTVDDVRTDSRWPRLGVLVSM